MAEKKERIEISKYDLNNKEWNGDTPIDIQKIYTRQEAIERITKAIAIKYFESVFSCENEEIEEYAEAALNALLEGK